MIWIFIDFVTIIVEFVVLADAARVERPSLGACARPTSIRPPAYPLPPSYLNSPYLSPSPFIAASLLRPAGPGRRCTLSFRRKRHVSPPVRTSSKTSPSGVRQRSTVGLVQDPADQGPGLLRDLWSTKHPPRQLAAAGRPAAAPAGWVRSLPQRVGLVSGTVRRRRLRSLHRLPSPAAACSGLSEAGGTVRPVCAECGRRSAAWRRASCSWSIRRRARLERICQLRGACLPSLLSA